MPPAARSKAPARAESAPVKAPRSCPNSSLSTSCAGKVVQSRVTKGPPCRSEFTCTARAKSPLPTPVSPRRSTVAIVSAARVIWRYTLPSASLRPMMWLKGPRRVTPGPLGSAARKVVSERRRANCAASAAT